MKKLMPIIVAVLLATFSLATQATASVPALTAQIAPTSPTVGHEGIIGNATFEFVSPICSPGQPPQPASGPNLVILSIKGRPTVLSLPLSWSLIAGCILFAPFQVSLTPGTYSVTISPCNYPLPCSHLPITVDVTAGTFVPVKIVIQIGII